MGTFGDFNETAKLIIELVARWKNFPEQSKIHSLVLTLQFLYLEKVNSELYNDLFVMMRELYNYYGICQIKIRNNGKFVICP